MNARVRIGSMGPWPVQSLGGTRPRAAMLRQEREDVGAGGTGSASGNRVFHTFPEKPAKASVTCVPS
jgi:hypothetical protein